LFVCLFCFCMFVLFSVSCLCLFAGFTIGNCAVHSAY
jgi:hypothetical protein